MTDYYLTTQGMRVVEVNDAGNVTYRREYAKGDKVDTSHMDDARVDTLVESGDLVTKEDDVPEDSTFDNLPPATGGGPVGAAAVDAAGRPVAPTGEPGVPISPDDAVRSETTQDDTTVGALGADDDGSQEHDVDKYDSMDYQELKAAAKDANLDTSGNAETLRTRLRTS